MTKTVLRFRHLPVHLIAAQACYYMIVSIDLTLTGLVGMSFAPVPALVTLPLSLIVVVGGRVHSLPGMRLRASGTGRSCWLAHSRPSAADCCRPSPSQHTHSRDFVSGLR